MCFTSNVLTFCEVVVLVYGNNGINVFQFINILVYLSPYTFSLFKDYFQITELRYDVWPSCTGLNVLVIQSNLIGQMKVEVVVSREKSWRSMAILLKLRLLMNLTS